MYTINLYPEFLAKRRAQRRQTTLTAVLTIVAGLQLAVIGSQILNSRMLDEQIAALDTEMPRLQSHIETETQVSPAMMLARDLLDIRRSRTDWAPTLASLGRTIDRPIFLVEVAGLSADKHNAPRLTISGEQSNASEQLKRINALMDRLRNDVAFLGNFQSVALGKVEGDRSSAFEIQCRSEEATR